MYLLNMLFIFVYFPHSLVGKESACNAGNPGLIPGLGRSPGEGNGSPLQYSCLENPMGRGAWWAMVHGDTRVGHDLATKPPTTTTTKTFLLGLIKAWKDFTFNVMTDVIRFKLLFCYLLSYLVHLFFSFFYFSTSFWLREFLWFHFINFVGLLPITREGNGNPLQYSCLENPMDGGTW